MMFSPKSERAFISGIYYDHSHFSTHTHTEGLTIFKTLVFAKFKVA